MYKSLKSNNLTLKEIYNLMISGVSPRPIAFVGSQDRNNVVDLAPFSYFNAFGSNPPIIGFSPANSGRTGKKKDTLLNIIDTKEFSVSIVNYEMVEQVSLSSCEYDSNIDEFIKSGFKKRKSDIIKPPSVENSPFIMECILHKIIKLGNKPGSGNLILGEVVLFHVSDAIINEFDLIDPVKIDQIGRGGGPDYIDVKKSLFKISKPKGIGIGFDNLPLELLNSTLEGNQLAKLAGISKIPQLIKSNKELTLDKVINNISTLLDNNDIINAWQEILNWKLNNE